MVGIGEMYLAKFVVQLGLGPIAAGLIMTAPMLLGALMGLWGPAMLKRTGSFSKYLGLTAGLQGLMYFPLALLALTAPMFVPRMMEAGLGWLVTCGVFAIVTLYYFAGLATAAPWVTATGEMFPRRIMARFSAHRLRLLQGATLGALLLHGLIADWTLSLASRGDWAQTYGLDPGLCGFAAAFVLAGIMRLISAYHLTKYSEPRKNSAREQGHVHASDFMKRFRHGIDGRFLFCALAGNCALQIAQPYFNPFMLQRIEYTGDLYQWLVRVVGTNAPYSVLLAGVYLGRIGALSLAGSLAARRHPMWLMWIGGIMLPIMAVFWLWTNHFTWLLIGQMASGVALASWELGIVLMNYEAIKANERTAMITYYNVVNEVSKTGGSLVGGGILETGGKDAGAYSAVFYVSAFARGLILLLLARVRK